LDFPIKIFSDWFSHYFSTKNQGNSSINHKNLVQKFTVNHKKSYKIFTVKKKNNIQNSPAQYH